MIGSRNKNLINNLRNNLLNDGAILSLLILIFIMYNKNCFYLVVQSTFAIKTGEATAMVESSFGSSFLSLENL